MQAVWGFIVANWAVILGWLLFALSEIIGISPWKDNAVVQLVVNGLLRLVGGKPTPSA